MNRMMFEVARALRREETLSQIGLPTEQVLSGITGQVALIGNARSLADRAYGAQIDAADVVIRINRAPMTSPVSHGRRSDILALALRIDKRRLQDLNPGLIMWMSPQRKRLQWHVVTHPGFCIPPLSNFARVRQTLGATPTTGLMMIDLLSQTAASGITLYGFDFFASLSLSGRRTAAQVPHDFDVERRFVEALMLRDPRFTLRG